MHRRRLPPSAEGVRVGAVGDPVRTLANCVPLQGKLTEAAPVYWMHGSNRTGLGEYAGAVQMDFLVPPGAAVFAFTL